MALLSDSIIDRQVLVVMGTSQRQCIKKLPESIEQYTYEELRAFDSMWIEEWARDDMSNDLIWIARRWLDIRRWKLRAAAIKQHAERKRKQKRRR